jgi:hypothetical protein
MVKKKLIVFRWLNGVASWSLPIKACQARGHGSTDTGPSTIETSDFSGNGDHMVGAILAFAQERDSGQDFERCKSIPSDQATLDCLKKLRPNALSDAPAESAAALWPLIRTPRPNGGSRCRCDHAHRRYRSI